MTREEFETTREFNKKFPSKIYICPSCNSLSTNPYLCTNCSNQSTNFLYIEKNYKYFLKENNTENIIFRPIELLKGEKDDNQRRS